MPKFNSLVFTFIILCSITGISCKKEVINGTNGSNGTNGTNGSNGTNGLNSLIKTSTELAGINCATGGLKVDVGLDSNRNGILDNIEIRATSYICSNSPNSYSATINQTGLNPPISTIINNSLNLNITWSRISQGHYKGILSRSLDLTKSIILSNNIGVLCQFQNNNEISLDNSCGVNAYCDDFSNFNLEIKVY